MIHLRTKTVSLHANQKGEVGGKQKTLVNTSRAKNFVEAEISTKQTKVKVKVGASGATAIEVTKGGKLIHAQNIA